MESRVLVESQAARGEHKTLLMQLGALRGRKIRPRVRKLWGMSARDEEAAGRTEKAVDLAEPGELRGLVKVCEDRTCVDNVKAVRRKRGWGGTRNPIVLAREMLATPVHEPGVHVDADEAANILPANQMSRDAATAATEVEPIGVPTVWRPGTAQDTEEVQHRPFAAMQERNPRAGASDLSPEPRRGKRCGLAAQPPSVENVRDDVDQTNGQLPLKYPE